MARINLTDATMKRLTLPEGIPQAIYWDKELAGFGVVVGRTAKTFIANGWVSGTGRKKRIAIGQAGEPGPSGALWNVPLARKQARIHLGQMSGGEAPKQLRRNNGAGPTLRDAYEAHLEKLRKKQRAEATIETLEKGLPKYLSDWMDRPISDLTGEVLAQVHERIKAQAKARANANPANPKGGALANRVIAQVSACWSTLNKRLSGALGTWNPAKSVEKDTLKPKRERLTDVALPDWYARVQTMRNAIQRDGLVFALFTGLRSEDVKTTRFENVNVDARTLRLPDPKGGEGRAFTIPLSETALEIVERRRRENGNALLIAEAGGDNGFVFPGLDADGKVGPIADLRQQVHEGEKHTRFPAEDIHTLRRTYESVAHEAGVSELDLHVLTNHSYASHNVNATYISQHLDHLARCQATVDAALWSRIKPKPVKSNSTKKVAKPRGRHLRAVP